MRAPASFPYPASSPPRTVCLVLLAPLLSLAQGLAPTPSHPLAPAADAAHVGASAAPPPRPRSCPAPRGAGPPFPGRPPPCAPGAAGKRARPATPPSTVEGHKSPH